MALSSKDKMDLIVIWGDFKFTTKVANEIQTGKKAEGLSYYLRLVCGTLGQEKSVLSRDQKMQGVFFFFKSLLLG